MPVRRGVRFVLVFIGIAVFVSFAGMVLMYLLLSGGPVVPSAATLVMRPGGDLQEIIPDDVVGQVFGRDVDTVHGFIESLQKAKRDPRIRSVLLMPSTLSIAVLGQGAGAARRGARLPGVGQESRRLPRVRRRPRVLPGQRRRPRISCCRPARST